MEPLRGMTVISLAVNLPGPVAAAGLRKYGAGVVKVEPPGGDPLARTNQDWYEDLKRGQEIVALDLKQPEDQARLEELLETADLLLTSSRPAALMRLGLGRDKLVARYPRLSQVAITGHPTPHDDTPGHDLTYQASLGLLSPPDLPSTLLADLAGAERAVSAALALLLSRERGESSGYAEISLAESAATFADPLRYGMTTPDGVLGGGAPRYNLYRTRDGWISVATLEPHFWRRLLEGLNLDDAGYDDLASIFATRTSEEWEAWASGRDLPLAALREAPFPNLRKEP